MINLITTGQYDDYKVIGAVEAEDLASEMTRLVGDWLKSINESHHFVPVVFSMVTGSNWSYDDLTSFNGDKYSVDADFCRWLVSEESGLKVVQLNEYEITQ